MADVRVVRLLPADWALYREIRLEALGESPRAFGSTLDREEAFSPLAWRERLMRRSTFAARTARTLLGTAAGVPGEEEDQAELVGMWVRPEWRGRGVGDLLVRAVMEWAGHRGYQSMHLWVAEGNDAAERLYGRHGFVRTGAGQPMRDDDPSRLEWEMSRPLPPDGPAAR